MHAIRYAASWVIGQLIMTGLALVWVWVAGLRFLWRSGCPLWRALAWAYGLHSLHEHRRHGWSGKYSAGALVRGRPHSGL